MPRASARPWFGLALLLVALTVQAPLRAQCAEWGGQFGPIPAFDSSVYALTVFDDGAGPALYAGGLFTSAASTPAERVARGDGSTWTPLGAGIGDGVVYALSGFDDGSGPALYAGGNFTTAGGQPASRIAKWDGTSWSALGAGLDGTVRALAVFDGGQGPELVAGGDFTSAGGQPAQRVAKWNGTTWSPLSTGMPDGTVRALTVFDDSGGPELYAGGAFVTAGAVTANHIARWNGTSWSALGSGIAGGTEMGFEVSPYVGALAVHDDGSGPALFVGGQFLSAGGVDSKRIAKWTASGWLAAGGLPLIPFDFQAIVHAFSVVDLGSGPELFAGGLFFAFSQAGGPSGRSIARWTGASWDPLPGGVQDPDQSIFALAGFDDGLAPGADLYAGGDFDVIGTAPTENLSRWNGVAWSPSHATPNGYGLDGIANDMASADLGTGPGLYVAGGFLHAGALAATGIVRWDGTSWAPLGSGITSSVSRLAVFDDGTGPALYAGGSFWSAGGVAANKIARWSGSNWAALGSGLNGDVRSMAVFDDGSGSTLYVSGPFTVAGGVAVDRFARWDGTSWSAVTSGIPGTPEVLAVVDLGSGPALYAAFTAGGSSAIARWTGTSWSTVGQTNSFVLAIAAYDEGGGPALYAAGQFTSVDGVPANRIARWNGSSWSALGAGIGGGGVPHVRDLTVFHDGTQSALYAAGFFTTAGALAVSHLARWDGASWSGVGGGVSSGVNALHVFDDATGTGADLYLAGQFQFAGPVASRRVGVWRGCSVTSFCAGDGTSSACPCGNSGQAGHGCENSSGTGGALMEVSGSTVPDALHLNSSGELASALTIFLQGDVQIAPAVFGDGLRCIGGNLKRLYVQAAAAGAASVPGPGEPTITQKSASLGDPIATGSMRAYQAWYRDPDLAHCPFPSGNTWNLTNGVRVVW